MKTSWHYLATAILIMAVLLVGCGGQGTPTSTPVETEPPVVVTEENPSGIPQAVSKTIQLDPAITDDADSLVVSSLIYDGLTMLDENGEVQPALAVNWTVSDDQLDYVLNLRQDVYFQNGEPFTADAVLANFNRWFDPNDALHGDSAYPGWEEFFGGFKGAFDENGVAISPFDGIEKVDNYSVLIHLNRPVPDLLTYLAKANFAILNPSIITAWGASIGTGIDNAIGTGAYAISSWTDAGLVLTPNTNYWGTIPAEEIQIGWK